MDYNIPFLASISRNNSNPPSEEIFSAEKLISIGFLQTGERLKKNFPYQKWNRYWGFLYLYSWKGFFCFAASKIVNINELTNFSYFL